MNKEKLAQKISSLIQDKDFVLKLAETKSDAEAAKLFADNDCELTADKVKLVRDTLNSFLKGDIEISEDDLENVSGGRIDATKVLAVALAATLVIGGTYVATRPSQGASASPKSGGSWLINVGAAAGKAAAKVGGAVARKAAQPTNWQLIQGVFSKKQRLINTGMQSLGDVAGDVLAGIGE